MNDLPHQVVQQAEFERLMKTKMPAGNFYKHPNGDYVEEVIGLLYTGWVLAKAHSLSKQLGE